MVRIESYSFGEICINGETYYSDVMVWCDGSVELVAKKHEVSMQDAMKMVEGRPEVDVIVIGAGEQGMCKVSPEVREACAEKEIRIYVDPTPKAVDMFNGLAAQGRNVAGYFHLTC